mmetsp:Transcript_30039/g.61889  ORF Transcript_30039/g.61889 Transcript_30039/m.61889 type:complete len:239 (-) Transcript_30039:993-1709(-)
MHHIIRNRDHPAAIILIDDHVHRIPIHQLPIQHPIGPPRIPRLHVHILPLRIVKLSLRIQHHRTIQRTRQNNIVPRQYPQPFLHLLVPQSIQNSLRNSRQRPPIDGMRKPPIVRPLLPPLLLLPLLLPLRLLRLHRLPMFRNGIEQGHHSPRGDTTMGSFCFYFVGDGHGIGIHRINVAGISAIIVSFSISILLSFSSLPLRLFIPPPPDPRLALLLQLPQLLRRHTRTRSQWQSHGR